MLNPDLATGGKCQGSFFQYLFSTCGSSRWKWSISGTYGEVVNAHTIPISAVHTDVKAMTVNIVLATMFI